MTWILSGIIVILLCIIIYIPTRVMKSNFDSQEEEREIKERLHQYEVNEIREIENKIQDEKEKLYKEQSNLENYKTTQKGQIEQELAIYRATAEQEVRNINNIILNLQNNLVDLKKKRDNTLAIIKEEEKLKNENDFYRIILKQEDIEDIEQLHLIEKRINNKDVLRKLIYKTFIEQPMNSMFGRVGIKESPGVYKITNLKNNLVYIGQSTNVKNRIKAHIQASIGISTIASQTVHDAMAQDGLENFTFQLLEECSKDQLNDREKYYIDYYDSKNYGYNKTSGGARS